jgi:putative nucleotidyltransferase with HDIG domain
MSAGRVQALEREVAELREQLAESERLSAERQVQLERYAADLRDTYAQERMRAAELHASYIATARALSNAVEARDAYTGKHAERVAAYGLAVADAVGVTLTDEPEMELGFLLHDVGKVAIPDSILFKPEPLADHERALMVRHPVIGWEILRDVEFLGEARRVVRSHHERWDGDGYPDGLAGDEIPLAARVFAVADTLDALTTTRPYRTASSFGDARRVIEEESGGQFDPDVVDAFSRMDDSRFVELRAAVG